MYALALGKSCAGAPCTPAKVWFHTPFDHAPPRSLFRVSHCCCEPFVTALVRESARKPPLAYCGPAEQ